MAKHEIITEDANGRVWLWAALLDSHDDHVVFRGVDGTSYLSLVHTFDVFEWKGVHYEVQGWDAEQRRWWVEPLPTTLDLPVRDEPAEHRPPWSRKAS